MLDKSDSLGAIRDATISGFNEFLSDQQAEGGSAAMTLTLFDTHFKATARAVPLADAPPLDHTSYELSGLSALYDAIAHTMKITDDFVARTKPDRVLFVITTDGQEDSSHTGHSPTSAMHDVYEARNEMDPGLRLTHDSSKLIPLFASNRGGRATTGLAQRSRHSRGRYSPA